MRCRVFRRAQTTGASSMNLASNRLSKEGLVTGAEDGQKPREKRRLPCEPPPLLCQPALKVPRTASPPSPCWRGGASKKCARGPSAQPRPAEKRGDSLCTGPSLLGRRVSKILLRWRGRLFCALWRDGGGLDFIGGKNQSGETPQEAAQREA